MHLFNIFHSISATNKWIEYNSNSVTINEKLLLIKKIRLDLISKDDLENCKNDFVIDLKDYESTINKQSSYVKIIDFYLISNFGITKKCPSYLEFLRKARSSLIRNRSFQISNFNICHSDFGFRLNNCDDSIDTIEFDPMGIDSIIWKHFYILFNIFNVYFQNLWS